MNILKVKIYEDILLKSFWFSFSSLSQTYRRTEKSKLNPIIHLERIFIGKIGELSFIRWCLENGLINEKEFDSYEKESLSIYYGIRNVDSFDLKIRGKLIDVKTAAKTTYKYLIVPEDQWEYQKKDIYVGLALHCDVEQILKQKLEMTGKELMLKSMDLYTPSPTKKAAQNAEVWFFGFLQRESPKWEYHKKDKVCPEKPCYRVRLEDLIPIEKLKCMFTLD